MNYRQKFCYTILGAVIDAGWDSGRRDCLSAVNSTKVYEF